MTRLRLLSGAMLLVGLGLFGCSSGNPNANARVSGSLSYKGTPIKGAHMQFVTAAGASFEAQVSPDGTYQATDIAPGELIVVVNTESLNKSLSTANAAKEAKMRANTSQPPPQGRGNNTPDNPAPETLYIKIPSKYNNAKTSPLTVTLKSGRQVMNIDLTD